MARAALFLACVFLASAARAASLEVDTDAGKDDDGERYASTSVYLGLFRGVVDWPGDYTAGLYLENDLATPYLDVTYSADREVTVSLSLEIPFGGDS